MYKKYLTILTSMAALSMSAPSFAKTIIKIGHGTNEQFHMHRALLKFEELVEAGSQGEIDVQIFPSSQMGPDREMIEGVQTGVLEMAVPPSSFFSGWDNAFAVIELPYMYNSKKIAFDVLNSQAGHELLARLQSHDLMGLGWLELGVRQISNNTRPITKPDDLKGIKLRTMKVPAHVDTFKALGANPTPMNFGEVYSALQQGVIDGQENPVSIIDSSRFYEVQKYLSTTEHVFTVYMPVISHSFFNKLSKEQQSLIQESMIKAGRYQQEIIASEEAAQLKKIREAGVEVIELTPEQREVFSEKTKDVRKKYRHTVGKDIYDKWTAAVDKAKAQ